MPTDIAVYALGVTGRNIALKLADLIAATFAAWKQGPLSSYLIEITAEILKVRNAYGSLRADHILDAAGQKGAGQWSGDLGRERIDV